MVAGGVVYVTTGAAELAAFPAAGCDAEVCSALTFLDYVGSGPVAVAEGKVFVGHGSDVYMFAAAS